MYVFYELPGRSSGYKLKIAESLPNHALISVAVIKGARCTLQAAADLKRSNNRYETSRHHFWPAGSISHKDAIKSSSSQRGWT